MSFLRHSALQGITETWRPVTTSKLVLAPCVFPECLSTAAPSILRSASQQPHGHLTLSIETLRHFSAQCSIDDPSCPRLLLPCIREAGQTLRGPSPRFATTLLFSGVSAREQTTQSRTYQANRFLAYFTQKLEGDSKGLTASQYSLPRQEAASVNNAASAPVEDMRVPLKSSQCATKAFSFFWGRVGEEAQKSWAGKPTWQLASDHVETMHGEMGMSGYLGRIRGAESSQSSPISVIMSYQKHSSEGLSLAMMTSSQAALFCYLQEPSDFKNEPR